MTYDALPAWPLVRDGLDDLAAGRSSSVEALLVLIGAPRLRSIGLEVPAADVDDPDLALYHLLAREDSDSAHSRYNALIRQLVSFERAAECVK